jgi:hypothetical protein
VNVLIACECSGTVRDAFMAKGHNAWSCDIQPDDTGGLFHITGCAIEALKAEDWDLVIAHPPCTYLTVTANKWLKDQPPRKSGALVGAARREARQKGIEFFMEFAKLKCKYAIENPVGCISSEWRKPDQIIQPYEYGHKEPKKTCLWLQGLPKLKPTKFVEPEYHTTTSGKRMPKWYAYADKKDRSKTRSKTFKGIADAMADQWG